MPGEQEWGLLAVVFLGAALIWIGLPRYRTNNALRLALAIPAVAAATMLGIAVLASAVTGAVIPD
jgi:hypothetical protein